MLWRTAASSTEIENNTLHAVMCTPIVTEEHVYGVGSYGELRCLEADTGRTVWETRKPTGEGRWWNAFLIPHEDRVVICNEQGEIIFAKLSPRRLPGTQPREADRADAADPAADDRLVAPRIRHAQRLRPQRRRAHSCEPCKGFAVIANEIVCRAVSSPDPAKITSLSSASRRHTPRALRRLSLAAVHGAS